MRENRAKNRLRLLGDRVYKLIRCCWPGLIE